MIEIYSTPTANGQKIHIVLEELGLPYRVHNVDLPAGAHRAPDMLKINPVGKVPSLYDPDGPGGQPLALGETGAIALYLARKAGRLGPETVREQAEFDYWSHAIAASLAMPFAMQFYFANLAPERPQWAIERFTQAAKDMLNVFDDRLATRHFMIGEHFTVIDALLYPHLATSAARIGGLVGFDNLGRYAGRIGAREAVKRGMAVLQG